MKKKIALALATIVSASALTAGVSAEEYTKANLLVNGAAVETDQPAVIVEGRTMVPVRVVAESLGSKVDWDGATKTVKFTKGVMTASMVVGASKLTIAVDDVESDMAVDVPASIINKRTMVPIRFLTETFGYEVKWDAVTKTVDVISSDEKKDDTESGAAAEALTADDIKAQFEALDALCGKLNGVADKMNEDDAKTYADVCDKIATVGKVLGTTDMDDEAEFKAAKEALDKAEAAIKAIADEVNVDLEK